MKKAQSKPFLVYMTTNTVNGKRYIGMTGVALRKRQSVHFANVKSGKMYCRLFHRAIKKYGRDAFKWEILCRVATRQEAWAEEIRLIAELKPEYNLTNGGEGGGRKISRQQRAALSRPVTCVTTGKKYPSLVAAARSCKISIGRLSVVCNKGGLTKGLVFKFSDQEHPPVPRQRTKEEIEKHKRGVEAGRQKAIDKCRIPIVCLDTGVIYKSISEAVNEFGFGKIALYSSLHRGHKCGGFTFVFYTGQPIKQRYSDPLYTGSHGAKRVICLNDNMLFDSVKDASIFYKLGRKGVDDHLKGRRKSPNVYGQRFSYLDEWCANPE